MDEYSKLPRLYGMENITTKEVMDKLGIFQARFGEVDKFGGGICIRSKLTLVTRLLPRIFNNFFLYMEFELYSHHFTINK